MAEAHKIWRLGNTGIELQRGQSVSHYQLPAHFHDDYQFMLVETGAREISFRGDRHVFGGDYLTIVNPAEIHSTGCHGEHGSSFETMRLPVSIWTKNIDGFPKEPLFPFEVENPIILTIFDALYHQMEHEGYTLRSQELLEQFSDLLMSTCKLGSTKRKTASRTEWRLRYVRDFIQENYNRPLLLDELANLADLSKYHFLRAFSAAMGMTPHAFQLRIRINRAKEMLANGQSIKQIAALTGFTDASHFGRNFLHVVGFTPRSYQISIDARADLADC